MQLLVTCEHGGNRVPGPYAALFRGGRGVLATHRGYDAGALELARRMARRFDAPLAVSTTTRLLADLNRSPGHPRLFSEFTSTLDESAKRVILLRHHEPYRRRVQQQAAASIGRGRRVLHVSVHSFTPELDGEVRNADVGLLYDPRRKRERRLALLWRSALRSLRPELRVRRNYPYLGRCDGLVTTLRGRFPVASYLGLELEVNQLWSTGDRPAWQRLQRDLLASLADVLAGLSDS
jgi:predicted N-formylglutamate amidohydrolase